MKNRLSELTPRKGLPGRFTVRIDLRDTWLSRSRTHWKAEHDLNFHMFFATEPEARDFLDACHILARDMGALVYGQRLRKEDELLVGSLEAINEDGNVVVAPRKGAKDADPA